MRRLILILLMLVLPVQSSWSAMDLCGGAGTGNSTSASAGTQHAEGKAWQTHAGDDASQNKTADSDCTCCASCSSCHTCAGAGLPLSLNMVAFAASSSAASRLDTSPHATRRAVRPERPKWLPAV